MSNTIMQILALALVFAALGGLAATLAERWGAEVTL